MTSPSQEQADEFEQRVVNQLRERQAEYVEGHLAMPADYLAHEAADLIDRLRIIELIDAALSALSQREVTVAKGATQCQL